MNFEINGMGQPTTMISGIASEISSWSLQVPSFSLNVMTICFDNRGAGKTDAPDRPYTIEMMANDTVKLLDVIGVEASNLVGFGMGGRIALDIAIRHPSKVKNLVLCSTAAKVTPSERELLQTTRDVISSGGERAELARKEAMLMLSPRFFKDERLTEGVVKLRLAMMRGTSDQGFLRQIDAVLDYDATARLQEIRCPALVVAGSHDRLVPIEHQRAMAERIPESSFLALESAHMILTESAREFNEGVIGFLMEKEV
ncbi:MAG: alpha/beta hydrolase [Methanomassiliicoccales archaeon]|nr:alpha/beta hydrolase [Methanomassiliicoccales archaeon]